MLGRQCAIVDAGGSTVGTDTNYAAGRRPEHELKSPT
jgi:hypothetical protein